MNKLAFAVAMTNRHRKLIALLVGLVVTIFGERAGISLEALTLAVITLATYIAGASVEDGLKGHS